MNALFSQYPLDKLCNNASIEPGFAFKSERFTDNPADVALVKGENVQQGFIDWSLSKYWPASDADAFSKYKLKIGDVVLAMDRPWVSSGLKWAYVKPDDPESLLVQRVARLRGKKSLDQTYLRSLISSDYFSSYIQPIVTGVNVPHISGKQIGDFNIPLPSLKTQRKIAAILSAYDDLIENNRRRIALLEKMAEEIYREWFVRMRFPGHEQAKFEKGVPVGWKLKSIGSLCSRVTDGAHFSPELVADGKYMASVKDMEANGFSKRSMKTISTHDFESLEKSDCKPIKGDVLIAKDGSYLKHAFVWNEDFDVVILSSIAILRPNPREITSHFLATLLKQDATKTMMSGYVSGSALPRIILKDFKGMNLLIPTFDLVEQFEEVSSEMFKQISLLSKGNDSLMATRDALLPRLISGKLAVEDLDIRFPPSMAESGNGVREATLS